jgi:hypothetical protein
MAMDVLPRFEDALRSESPTRGLRSTVKTLLHEGWDRDQVQEALEAYRARIRQEGRSSDEDVVLEVMDFLAGWASPHVKL